MFKSILKGKSIQLTHLPPLRTTENPLLTSRSLISNPEDNPAKEVHKTNKTKSFMVISCRPIMVLNWSLNLWPFYPKIDRRNEHIASKIQVYKVSLIVILLHDISHLGKLSKCNEEKNLPRLQTLDSIWQSSRWDEFIFRKFFAKHNNRKIVFVKSSRWRCVDMVWMMTITLTEG